MHGAQRVRGMRLQQSFLQVEPEFRSARRHRRQGRKRLLDAVFGGRAQLQAVVRHEMKQPQQHLGILQRRRLLQKDETIHHGKIRRRKPRAPALHLPVERRPGFRNFFQQLRDGALHGAGVAEINPHPVGRRRAPRNPQRRSRRAAASSCASQLSVLSSRPWRKCRKQRADIRKSSAASSCLRTGARKRTGVRPVVELVHRGNQRQPAGDVAVAQSAGRLLQIRLQVIQRLAIFRVPLARHFRQSLQQGLGFPHHDFGNHLIVQAPEKIVIAREIAAIEKRNREFGIVGVVAVALR